MIHKLFANHELNLGSQPIPKGTLVATIETEHDIDRVIRGAINGHLTRNEPKPVPAPTTESAPPPAK